MWAGPRQVAAHVALEKAAAKLAELHPADLASIIEDLPYHENRVVADPDAKNGMRFEYRYTDELRERTRLFRRRFKTTLLPRHRILILTGEKASGTFLIDQAKLVATNVSGTVVQSSGHWLMEEAPDQVIPAIVTFLKNE